MLTAVGVYAQGTVNFANNSSTQVIDEADGMPVTNADGILAALYWAPLSAPNNFTQLGGSARIQSINVPSFLGVYNGGARTTGNETAAGAAAWFEVRAWDMAYASYEEALGVGKTGKTDPFMVTTGGAGTPASTPANLVGNGLTGFSVAVVPEPSVVALGLLGAGALLLIRRRK
jgi:MYXO-CTERM domain-containing protein